jgi:hypothetical protein
MMGRMGDIGGIGGSSEYSGEELVAEGAAGMGNVRAKAPDNSKASSALITGGLPLTPM